MRKRGLVFFFVVLVSLVSAEELTSETVAIWTNVDSGNLPLEVNFKVNSAKEFSSVAWDFNNDGKIDSTEKEAVYTYVTGGSYLVKLTVTSSAGETLTLEKKIMVNIPLTVSVAANPSSGMAPLSVQFTAAATGKEPLAYAWDFNGDGTIDSTNQNPSTTFDAPKEYEVSLTVTDATGNKAIKTLPLTVSLFDSKINITSYFPTTLQEGENQITFIVVNQGKETQRDLTAKIIGKGIQHLSSSSISSLKPGDQDSLTLKVNVLQSGTAEGMIKILDKSFPLSFTVTKPVQYNKEELQNQYDSLKEELQQQEKVYSNKKAQGYLVTESFESIKSIKKQIQDIQEAILTDRLAEAKVGLDLASTAVDDLTAELQAAKKQKQTVMMWLKDNALAITAIIAALGTLSGILIKVSHHAKKMGEDVKQKIVTKKSSWREHKEPTHFSAEKPPEHQEKEHLPEEEKKG